MSPLPLGDGPDLGGIGNAASARKRDTGGSQTLQSFSVKKGDNGGVIVCETYKATPPAGRRYGASFPDGGDYKENPFSPDDGAAAGDYVTGLLGQMGVTATPEAPPAAAAVRGPLGGGAVAARGAMEEPPSGLGY